MKIIEANSIDLIADSRFVVVFTSKIHCGACKTLEKTIARMPITPFYIYSIDVDDYPDEASKYSVMSLPTILFIGSNHRVIDEINGTTSSDTLLQKMEGLL